MKNKKPRKRQKYDEFYQHKDFLVNICFVPTSGKPEILFLDWFLGINEWGYSAYSKKEIRACENHVFLGEIK